MPRLKYRNPVDGEFYPLTGSGPTGPAGPSGEMFVQPDEPDVGSEAVPAEFWVDTDDESGSDSLVAVLDAKGDLLAGTGPDVAARVPVGSDGQVLTADSAQATGVKWGAVPTHTHTGTYWGLWTGNQAAYDAIVTKDPNILYVVV